jgi:DNA-binding MarR family transcriptional regulator
MHDYMAGMQDDFSRCLLLNSRMAARAVTRRYDRELRPFGVTAAQFTILSTMSTRPNLSVTDLAKTIAMDRTTLSRNLDLLERKGLIVGREAEKGNGRLVSLSEQGEALTPRLMPVWRGLQSEMNKLLGDDAMNALIDGLQRTSQI